MDNFVVTHIIAGMIYMVILIAMNTLCKDTVNQIESELVAERNLRKQVEEELETEQKKVTGLTDNVEYCNEQYRVQEASLVRVLNKNDMLQDLVSGQDHKIEKLQEKINDLNAKLSKIVTSATQLVEESEMPHLIPV